MNDALHMIAILVLAALSLIFAVAAGISLLTEGVIGPWPFWIILSSTANIGARVCAHYKDKDD